MRHKFKKLLSLVLALILCFSMAQPAYAAYYKGFNWGSWFKPSWNQGQSVQKPSKPNQSTGGAGQSSSGSQDATMTLLEDESTVTEGTALRASTYALGTADTEVSPLAYNAYSEVTDSITWAELITEDDTDIPTIYYWSTDSTNYYEVTVTRTPTSVILGTLYYNYKLKANSQTIASASWQRDGTATISLTSGKLYTKNASSNTVLKYFPVTMYNYDAATINAATAAKDGNTGTGIYFNGGDPQSLTGPNGGTGGTYNYWTGNATVDNTKNGDRTYSGLVESTLTANKDITFTKPDGGIFNGDATVKDIYTNVELPFEYDSTTKYYEFNAKKMGARFDGTPASNVRLAYSQTPQKSSNTNVQDEIVNGYVYGWYPYNDTDTVTDSKADYHFGMRATIPFTMTSNGKMSLASDAADIEFQFEGDDDVWVFIDGQLVLDLGGIHNRMKGTLNFANNTYEISAARTNANKASDVKGASLTGKIFNDDDGNGKINTTRETFAATDSHELSIFYLDRGKGTSNCQIKFNLPMKDTVSVRKLVNEKDSYGAALDSGTLAQINNRDFGFTLYKDGSPVVNANYSLLNENGQYISTPSTDANGHFTLKNGQTAKFVGEIDSENGNSYYVVEDADDAAFWTDPTWIYTANVANGAADTASTVTNAQSMTVTATGSSEAEDSIVFTCTNTWVHQNNTSISAVDDKIVIDYGLPVVIDVLANDTVSNGTKSIEKVKDAQYGNADIQDGKIIYQLTQPLTGVEVLTYTVKATASSGVESDNKTDIAKVYIIPATSMYYEENFSDLVTFTGSWSNVGTAQTDPQEPGVVGTVGDSPYGSDAAYRNDSGDSNGSSKYVNTSEGEASFSYTFTGTGTSFFARTSSDSAYMRVVVKDSSGNTVSDTRRNNIYKAVDGTEVDTLYNVPVFTSDKLGYDTYTVTVTLMKANAAISRGSTFYLDGIRVISPLDPGDANVSVANAAYATDGEANMTVVTLRQKLLGDANINEDGTLSWDGTNFAVFTDSNGEITSAEEYRSNGPKEEVYLNNGQSVTFSLYDWDPNTNKIYLGVKAPQGSGTVSINGNTLNLSNATDCYYDISNYASITEVDGVQIATFKIESTRGLISVTNIKVTGNAEFTIVEGDDETGTGEDVYAEGEEDIV